MNRSQSSNKLHERNMKVNKEYWKTVNVLKGNNFGEF